MKIAKKLITIMSIMLLSTNICWGQDIPVERTDSIWGANMFLSENQDSMIVTFYTSANLKEAYDHIYLTVTGTMYISYIYTELSKFQFTEQKLSYSTIVTFKFGSSEEIPFESIKRIDFYFLRETKREETPIKTNRIVYYRDETSLNMIHSEEDQYEKRFFSLTGEEYSDLNFKDNIYITAIYKGNKLVRTFKSYKTANHK